MNTDPITLKPQPLTRTAFMAFGDIIETTGSKHYSINNGYTERFHDLASVDVTDAKGRPLINIFRGEPLPLPFRITDMERHPLSSQAFVPLSDNPFLVLVAEASTDLPITSDKLRLFITDGKQGVNYHRGVWHHFLITLNRTSDFVVVDRGGREDNCDTHELVEQLFIDL